MKFWLKISAATLALTLLFLTGAGLWIAQSDWLREKVRSEIVSQAERATGGKVELGAFRFDWHTLTAEVDRFVIRGTEPAGDAPLLRVERARVEFRIVSFFSRAFTIASAEAFRPEAHLIVAADGKTNLPHPRIRKPGKNAAEVILDLKIARFNLQNGSILLEAAGAPPRIQPWNARGENLRAQVAFDPAGARYTGNVALAPLHLAGLDLELTAAASMEPDRVLITGAKVKTANSEVELHNTELNHFASPVWTGQYQARVALRDFTKLARGTVTAAGTARYVSLGDYHAAGKLSSADFGVAIQGIALENLRVDADFDADPEKIVAKRARVQALGGEIAGAAELRNFERFKASGRLENFNLARAVALAAKQHLPYDAALAGPFDIQGTLRNQTGSAQLTLTPVSGSAPVHGEVAVRFDTAAHTLDLGQSFIDLPHSRVEVSGALGAASGANAAGGSQRLAATLNSTDAAELLPFLPGEKPDVAWGDLHFSGAVTGPLDHPRIAGSATAQKVRYQQQTLDSLAADFALDESRLTVAKSDVAWNGIHAKVLGNLALANWQGGPKSIFSAVAELHDADLSRILTATGYKDTPVSGSLSGTAQITGSVDDPRGAADVSLANGQISGQPYDSITGRVQLVSQTARTFTGLFVSGPKRVNISTHFDQNGAAFSDGNLDFNLTSNTMPLNEINLVRERQPDIHGFGKFHVDGMLRFSHDAKKQLQQDLVSLNADASANGLELAGRNLGDARLLATTKNAVMTTHFESNAANASIRGDGTVQLAGDYPVEAKVKFSNAALNSLVTLLATPGSDASLNVEGTLEGELDIRGPARTPDEMTATLDVPKVEVHPLPGSDFAHTLPNFSITNNGPIRVSVSKRQVRVESARLKAPQTDLTVGGTVALTGTQSLDLRVQGNMNLALVRSLNADLSSSGILSLDGAVRGNVGTPELSGRATLRNGEFHYADFSNGLTGANGEIAFSGTRATIQSLTAESGGGRVDVNGFVSLNNGLPAFRIEAKSRGVRVRYPEGVSSISDADLTLAGTSQRSDISGLVTIHRVVINPKTDAASILAASAEPLKTSAKTGIASNMNFDVQISTAPDVVLQTSLTQSIQADANLRLRGTVTNPAVLGRVNVTQGELVFFGNKYSISQGSVSFFNPGKIEPVLNVDLETKARGVDVVLTLSGPLNKLNVTYRSDPPLQFSDILALLATGRTPSDPTLAINSNGQSQSFDQLGANTLIGQAIANPVAGRLQRFFGVSRIKIDPQLTGITGSPQARLTIEQQVTPEILFTYITDVSSTSTQLIRVEWAFNPNWSAILIREENGYVGLDFAYKKRFK